LAAHGRDAGRLLDVNEVEPDVWQARLAEELHASGGGQDEEILPAAQLLQQLDVVSVQTGKYVVNTPEAKGVQIGKHNTQTNTFN
jgi:hypothetical protein